MSKLLDRIRRLLQGRKSSKGLPRTMPSWSEIVEGMHDTSLNYVDEVVKVIYSDDQAKRFVLLKRHDGIYRYSFERLYAYDEDEWQWNCMGSDALPGYWVPLDRSVSLFGSEQEAWRDLISSPEYKTFF